MTDTEKQFQPLAEQYAEQQASEEASRYEMKVNWPSIQRLLPAAPAKLLDYGCGAGTYSRALLAAGYDVLLVDNSPDMLQTMDEELKQKSRVWSYQEEPLPEVFDGVLAKLVVQFVDDLPQFAAAMRRQLRAGGRLVISVPNPIRSKRLAAQQGSAREYLNEIGTTGLTVTMIHRDFNEYQETMQAAGFRFRQSDTPVDPQELYLPPRRLNMLFEAV